MFKKISFLMIILSLGLLLLSVCWAEGKPFEDVTGPNDVIEKVFVGRTLDPIEGVWVRDPGRIMAIVKSSVIYPDQPQAHAYHMIKIKGFNKQGIGPWFERTEYDFCFKEMNVADWKLLSPTILEKNSQMSGYPMIPSETFVRIYPASN